MILSFLVYWGILHKHIISRYSIVSKPKITIIFKVKSILVSNIPNINSWQRFMCLAISNFSYKSMRSKIVSIDYESCHDYYMGSKISKISWPKFISSYVRGMKNKGISLLVKSGSSLNSLYIWSMPKFSLCISSMNLAS